MTLLLAMGEQPFRLVHGSGRDEWHIALLEMDEVLSAIPALAEHAVRIGRRSWLVLVPQKGFVLGQLPETLRDAETGQWSSSVSVQRYRVPADELDAPPDP